MDLPTQFNHKELYKYLSWCDDKKPTCKGFAAYYIEYLYNVVFCFTRIVCLFRKHDWKEYERVRVEGEDVQYTGVIVYECLRCGKEISEDDYVERMLF